VQRTTVLCGATVCLIALCDNTALGNSAAPSLSAVRKAIDAANRQYLRSLEAGDATAHAALYAIDGIQMPSSKAAIVRSRATIASKTALDLKDTKYLKGSIVTSNIAVYGDAAYEAGTYSFTYQEKKKQPATATGRYFVVWQRQTDGSYLIKVDSGFPQVCPH
jgi:ketosteroid isomerase-like protein